MSPYRIHFIFLCSSAFLLAISSSVNGQIEGIYCGKENCYDVLGITRDDDKAAVTKAYRQMARVHHPDRQKTIEGKEEAEKRFKEIVVAYEILRDEEQRREYDYMLDNPEAMYYHYYQYFRRRLSPQVDVRIVVAVLISLVSVAQYYVQWSEYEEAVSYLVKTPKFRSAAKEYAKSNGLLGGVENKKKDKKLSKDALRDKEEKILRTVITSNKLNIKPFEVKKGTFHPPSIRHILWVQIFTKPVASVRYLWSWARWILLYWILKREMTLEDKLEQIRWNLKSPHSVWDYVEDDEKEYYLKLKLWEPDAYKKYAEEQEELERKRLAEDNKYKRYQRWMRKGGPGQIVFGPEDVDMDFGDGY